MTAPVLPPELAFLRSYLQRLEDRVGALESPQQPGTLFAMASASLTASNAKTYVNCLVFVTDLNICAHSNGSHWYREDTGALII